jgi:hypothetical protein
VRIEVRDKERTATEVSFFRVALMFSGGRREENK